MPNDEVDDDLTKWLGEFASGKGAPELLARVYPELREIAERVVGRRRDVVTLQPTALVHEAYLRLAGKPELAITDRTHFFALAARVMRFLLVDTERRRHRREGLGGITLELAGATPRASTAATVDLLDLDLALAELERRSPRQARVVELRYFGGLEIEQVASVIGTSHATVERDWQAARAWLGSRLSEPPRP